MVSSEEFKEALQRTWSEAAERGMTYVDINAGRLHRDVGGYPGRDHRMPLCSRVMRTAMVTEVGDTIVQQPPSGQGARLTVRYVIPRPSATLPARRPTPRNASATAIAEVSGHPTTSTPHSTNVKIADEVWIGTALLHHEHPAEDDFSIDQIVGRVQKEGIETPLRPGVYVHVVQHCVANRPPNPARYRMLYESGEGRRRLYRRGDTCHPAREGAKITPSAEDLPAGYRYLLAWYGEWSKAAAREAAENDPLLALRGSGRALWSDEHADDYVRRLREGWE